MTPELRQAVQAALAALADARTCADLHVAFPDDPSERDHNVLLAHFIGVAEETLRQGERAWTRSAQLS